MFFLVFATQYFVSLSDTFKFKHIATLWGLLQSMGVFLLLTSASKPCMRVSNSHGSWTRIFLLRELGLLTEPTLVNTASWAYSVKLDELYPPSYLPHVCISTTVRLGISFLGHPYSLDLVVKLSLPPGRIRGESKGLLRSYYPFHVRLRTPKYAGFYQLNLIQV